jgi:serine/threonine-protein kinase RsbW
MAIGGLPGGGKHIQEEREEAQEGSAEVMFEGENWELPAVIEIADKAAEEFIRRAEAAGWDTEEEFGLKLGFREALANAVVHGSGGKEHEEGKSSGKVMAEGQATDKKVYVTLQISKDRIYFKIRDEGKGFDPGAVADPLLPENLMKQSGRGLFYLRSFFTTVKHNDVGNEIEAEKLR